MTRSDAALALDVATTIHDLQPVVAELALEAPDEARYARLMRAEAALEVARQLLLDMLDPTDALAAALDQTLLGDYAQPTSPLYVRSA